MNLITALLPIALAMPGAAAAEAPIDALHDQATAGDAAAQLALATRYLKGDGSWTDLGPGYFWALVAEASGHPHGAALSATVERHVDDADFLRIVRARAAAWTPGARGMPYASGVLAVLPPVPPDVPLPPFDVWQITDAGVASGPTAAHPQAAWTLTLAPRPLDTRCDDAAPAAHDSPWAEFALAADGRVLGGRLHDTEHVALSVENLQAAIATDGNRLRGTLHGDSPVVSAAVGARVEFELPLGATAGASVEADRARRP